MMGNAMWEGQKGAVIGLIDEFAFGMGTDARESKTVAEFVDKQDVKLSAYLVALAEEQPAEAAAKIGCDAYKPCDQTLSWGGKIVEKVKDKVFGKSKPSTAQITTESKSDLVNKTEPLDKQVTNTGSYKTNVKKDGTPHAKPGTKPKGEGEHNAKIEEIVKRETADGKKKHIGGHDKTEITVKTTGGEKPERRMDASFEDVETGEITHHNVGKFNKRGDPIKRERVAADDVKKYAPPEHQNIIVEEYKTK